MVTKAKGRDTPSTILKKEIRATRGEEKRRRGEIQRKGTVSSRSHERVGS